MLSGNTRMSLADHAPMRASDRLSVKKVTPAGLAPRPCPGCEMLEADREAGSRQGAGGDELAVHLKHSKTRTGTRVQV